jgi:hypothetical protein
MKEKALKNSHHIPIQIFVDRREELVPVWRILEVETGSLTNLVGIVDYKS